MQTTKVKVVKLTEAPIIGYPGDDALDTLYGKPEIGRRLILGSSNKKDFGFVLSTLHDVSTLGNSWIIKNMLGRFKIEPLDTPSNNGGDAA